MKQIFSSLSTGKLEILELPEPQLKDNHILICTNLSMISVGTERMLVRFGKSNYLDKALQQPDKVKEVINKSITDGPLSAIEAVRSKLSNPLPLGYSNVGRVIGVGKSVRNFQIGDRVISNGGHAETVLVSQNLCAHIPDQVSDRKAVFTVVGSIGLQGIRLAKPTFGEVFLVSGLGLIGLLTAQLLKAQGCRVLGVDIDKDKCSIAEALGIEVLNLSLNIDPVKWCLDKTFGDGVDGALITATTASSDPIHVAAKSCRQKGRIVLVGVTGLELRRNLFYEKELSFQVSCSYGPGRYDPSYEVKGIDYPIGFVRWTEQRNFVAILDALKNNLIDVDPLISNEFEFDKFQKAFDILETESKAIGILLKYNSGNYQTKTSIELGESVDKESHKNKLKSSKIKLGFIGCGNYSSRILIPSFKKAGAKLGIISSTSGLNPVVFGKKYGFSKATTDIEDILSDKDCNTIIITTRHDSHAEYIKRGMLSNKNILIKQIMKGF